MTIPRRFYARDTVLVARELLGKRIVRKVGGMVMSGMITETEAYGYGDDPASHAFGGMTVRNRAMFGQVGMAYVYFTYGMHHCFNVVARGPGAGAGAVLIRGIVPELGIKPMQKNRGIDGMKNLADGPAKMAQAMKIDRRQYGVDLTCSPRLHIADGPRPRKVASSPRIGIKKGTEKMWNFRIP